MMEIILINKVHLNNKKCIPLFRSENVQNFLIDLKIVEQFGPHSSHTLFQLNAASKLTFHRVVNLKFGRHLPSNRWADKPNFPNRFPSRYSA